MDYGNTFKNKIPNAKWLKITDKVKFRMKLEIGHNLSSYDEGKDYNDVIEDMFRIFGLEPPVVPDE